MKNYFKKNGITTWDIVNTVGIVVLSIAFMACVAVLAWNCGLINF